MTRGGVPGGRVEHEIAAVEALAEGMLVGLARRGKDLGRVGLAAGFDDLAVRFCEGEPAGCFGVAGDIELALVMIPVARATQAPQVRGICGSLVGPVLDVVHFQPACGVA